MPLNMSKVNESKEDGSQEDGLKEEGLKGDGLKEGGSKEPDSGCRSRQNIVLIGMPGCGKSTTGVLLAKTLGMSFLDTDLILQQRESSRLQDLVDTLGFDGFRKAEERAILSVDVSGCVIATGGSVVYSDAGMAHLKKNGLVLYLKVTPEEIERRITNISTRGIALHPGQTLSQLYDERSPLYEKYADIVVPVGDMTIEETVTVLALDVLKAR